MTITLITGGNRGLGYETARQLAAHGHDVWIGARSIADGEAAAESLGVRFVQLDVTDEVSVDRALARVGEVSGSLDVLVNNAGVISPATMDLSAMLPVFETNVFGVARVTEAALPLLKRSAAPTVVAVSSSMGSFWAVTNSERPESDVMLPLYSASKTAATMLMVQYARLYPRIKFNAVEPGYTATDMTAPVGGGRPVEDGVRIIVRMATLDADGPSGTFQEEAGVLRW